MAYYLYPPQLKLDEEEASMHRYLDLVDVAGIPVYFVLYCLAGSYLSDGHPHEQEYYTGWVNMLVWGYMMYLHCYCCPKPLKGIDPLMFRVQSVIGRWVFLTYNTFTFQAVHGVMSFVDPAMGNAMAVVVGGMGVFVTVQYFALCHYHPDFIKSCQKWNEHGVDMYAICRWMHLPCGVFAFVDVAYTKADAALHASLPSPLEIAGVMGCFIVFYLTILHVNHAFTGEWPYDFMAPLGTSLKKWATMTVTQTAILSLFIGGMCAAAVCSPI
eukprot:TRINITY_DN24768_c0_g1_i1.p2 TRINITY_DN24768_c0_g1~~TRINITY_DN24768_c0_g1_i1.p2  ORF type:complete len:290 (+),score=101.42 TRINITY_DN24768_c0_g1_i1:62-871(+)